jgi:predicted short-subunit dehydrogenase-like oxidoreductase (DUF2520 family)
MKIVLIGAGNVGWHLGCRLRECGLEVMQVFSRNLLKAKELGEKIGAAGTNDLDEITHDGDLYILAVHDDAIGEIAGRLAGGGLRGKLMVHTSGATPATVFDEILERYGVFYPLQTFSKARKADFTEIPVCIDAKLEEDRKMLTELARKISGRVYRISDEQRAVLHVAAVFVNNFTNHLFHVGHSILEKEGLPFELLLPLIRETVEKLEDGTPAQMQTGPARRGDESTIQRHLAFLEKYPEYREVYRQLTQNIIRGRY